MENTRSSAHRIPQECLELLLWIAFGAMFIDHIGALVFHNDASFRSIGRIAFPLFAFVFATRISLVLLENPHKNFAPMLWRIIMSGIIAHILFVYVKLDAYLNIMFSFASAVFIIIFLDEQQKFKNIEYGLRVAVCVALCAYIDQNMDYGVLGLFLVLSIYSYMRWSNIHGYVFAMLSLILLSHTSSMGSYAMFSLLVIAFVIYKKYGVQRPIPYLFYWLYPAHLTLIILISLFFQF